jgi:hypothetical protein
MIDFSISADYLRPIPTAIVHQITQTELLFASLLPGTNPGLIVRAGRVASISFHASATSTTSSITGPATIQAGDLLVLSDHSYRSDSATPNAIVPSGFTQIHNDVDPGGTNRSRHILSYKIADGAEASASITGLSGGTLGKVLLVFRGNVKISSVTIGSPVTSGITDDNPASQSIAASGGTAPLVVLSAYYSNGAIDPRTFSTTKDAEVNSAAYHYFAYKIHNSAPADTSIDMDDDGNNNVVHGAYIAVG